MIEHLKSFGYYIESFRRDINDTTFSRIEIPENTIILFDLLGDLHINKFYETNYDSIKTEFQSLGYNFMFIPCIDFPREIEKTFEYYFPHLNEKLNFILDEFSHLSRSKEKDDFKYFSLCAKDNKKILNYLGYTGDIQSGFVVTQGSMISIIKYTNKDNLNGLRDPKELMLNNLSKVTGNNFFYSRRRVSDSYDRNFEESLEEKLDNEALKKVAFIKKQIDELKSSGKLLLVLPLLQETLDEMSNEVDLSSMSSIKISDDGKIYLPYFSNMEVPLSHLTKVIYLLFIRHPKGIDISYLYKYEKEIMDLYLSISNQENYDKMKQSVSDLVQPNKKSIYTHISRVKSTFYKLMDEYYANNYIIKGEGHGNTLKFIPALKLMDNDNEKFTVEAF